MKTPFASRRHFLASTGLLMTGLALADKRPPVTNPKATDGDGVAEPDWEKRLSISVGPKKADLVGSNEKVLQAAVDYMSRMGGGTVRVLPGEYRLRNAVHLRDKVRLLGSGADSILKKEASMKVKLADDSDWYDQEITLENAKGLKVGDGVCLRAKNPHDGGNTVIKRTLVARSGNRFKLNAGLRKNLWLSGNPTAATLFPILNCEHVKHVAIENITLDGNRANNENLNGNYAGCIFAQDCSWLTFRNVEARNYNGDGMSWQICHDVVVENCHSHDHNGLGLHPGSGSQRPVMRGNKLERNNIGIFFCWGVRHGIAENNINIENDIGISIGHRDTDNFILNNDVLRSKKGGIVFRPDKRGKDFGPHRNRVEKNRIVDSGNETGIGVEVRGNIRDITLKANEIRETRGAQQRVGVHVGEETQDVKLIDNKIEGFKTPVVREKK
ncbi:MAG: right-handed parallel beta-helix repeat-containing protein [Verrucomicrobiota bacterium]|nr:right-handed parallel beta-helix repeat-containing protein [Verrucomicrobiota bacterium]